MPEFILPELGIAEVCGFRIRRTTFFDELHREAILEFLPRTTIGLRFARAGVDDLSKSLELINARGLSLSCRLVFCLLRSAFCFTFCVHQPTSYAPAGGQSDFIAQQLMHGWKE